MARRRGELAAMLLLLAAAGFAWLVLGTQPAAADPAYPGPLAAAGISPAESMFPAFPRVSTAKDDGWKLGDMPNPYEQPFICGLQQGGPLCDPDGLLSAEGRRKVVNVLELTRAEALAKCPDGAERGFQVAVAVARKMHPSAWYGYDKQETTKRFAQELGDRWGVGDPGCGNGVVLFLSIEDRYAYIKTAALSQQLLTDAASTAVVDNMKPMLREADYDSAVLQGAMQLHDALQGKAVPNAETSDATVGFLIILFFGLMFTYPLLGMLFACVLKCLLMPVAMVMDYVASARGRRTLERVQQELDRDEFDQTLCPICLEDLPSRGQAGRVAELDCRHRFHRACIAPWANEHASCPLCRHEVAEPLMPEGEGEGRPKEYQRRLQFYLSRLQHRHPDLVGSSSGNMYRYRSDTDWLYYRAVMGDTPFRCSTYADSVQARYTSLFRHSQAAWSQMGSSSGHSHGGHSSFGGGGGFSGGGGGGGGW